MSEHEPTAADMVRVQGGKQYLPAAQRVQWMRGDHPDWTIDTSVYLLDWERGYAVMRAEIRNEEGRIIGAGTKTETRSGFGDFVEKAETGAVGRALARAGYGTEDALDLEGERYADAPIEQPWGGERSTRTHGRRSESRQAVTTRPAASQRSAEEQALLDRILAEPQMTHARMTLMADAVGVPKGQHATVAQLREMVARFIETPAGGVPPLSAGTGQAGGSVPPAPPDTASSEGSADPVLGPESVSTTPTDAVAVSPAAAASGPTLDEVLAASGGELIPPRPGTDQYKALTAAERAQTRAYWQREDAKPQPTLAEAMGGVTSD